MHSLFIFTQLNLQLIHKYIGTVRQPQCGILIYNDEIRIFAIFKITNACSKRCCTTHTHFAFFIQCLNHTQTKPLLFIAFYERTIFLHPRIFAKWLQMSTSLKLAEMYLSFYWAYYRSLEVKVTSCRHIPNKKGYITQNSVVVQHSCRTNKVSNKLLLLISNVFSFN